MYFCAFSRFLILVFWRSDFLLFLVFLKEVRIFIFEGLIIYHLLFSEFSFLKLWFSEIRWVTMIFQEFEFDRLAEEMFVKKSFWSADIFASYSYFMQTDKAKKRKILNFFLVTFESHEFSGSLLWIVFVNWRFSVIRVHHIMGRCETAPWSHWGGTKY